MKVPPGSGPPVASFCTTCGSGLVSTAVVCPACGTPVPNKGFVYASSPARKDKTVAVVLAVFLGFWTWLYTYRDSAAKFWTVLGVQFFFFLIWFLVALATFDDPFADEAGLLGTTVFGYILGFGFWLWALLDVTTKPRAYYENYGQR